MSDGTLTTLGNHWTLRPYGVAGWLVTPSEDPASTLPLLTSAIDESPPPHFVEWVSGYDDLLLLFSRAILKCELASFLQSLSQPKSETPDGKLHKIDVRYDGPDLEEIATAKGLTINELIHLHSTPCYNVRLLGFAPGFAYLDGLDPKLHHPRRSSPRAQMIAGAVAIGGAHTGVYSVPSPGGWNWIGNSDHPLFTPENSDHPFTLAPGDKVQLRRKN